MTRPYKRKTSVDGERPLAREYRNVQISERLDTHRMLRLIALSLSENQNYGRRCPIYWAVHKAAQYWLQHHSKLARARGINTTTLEMQHRIAMEEE